MAARVPTRRGRRPGSESSRAEVLRAATTLFAQEGYDATTIRAIAVQARVDSAMVIHFFGTKEQLFATVLQTLDTVLPVLLAALDEPGPDRGARVATTYLGLWEDPEVGPALRALIRSAIGSPRATSIVQQYMTASTLAARSEFASAAAILLGTAIARYIVGIGPLASMPFDDLVRRLAPSVQAQLD